MIFIALLLGILHHSNWMY